MRKAVAVLLLALVAVAAAVSSAQAAQKGLDLDDPSALRAALSHHDRRMDGAEDPERFMEKAGGKEPHYYGAAHDAEDDGAEGAGGDDDDDDDDDDEEAGVDEQHPSKGLRDAFKTYRFRGTSTQMRAQYMRFQELSARAQREDLSASEAAELESMQKRARAGFWKKKKGGKKFSLKKTFTKIKDFGKKVVGGVVAIAGAATASASKVVNGGNKNLDKMLAQDIEDCVGCRFVWLGVELEVGNSQVEETVYDSFVKRCMEAEKAPIFFQTCQDMFDDVYGMIGDYMNGYTVNQVCEGAKMCR